MAAAWPRRVDVNARHIIIGFGLLTGCAGAQAPVHDARSAEAEKIEAQRLRITELEAELAERRAEIRRLESEVALLRAARMEARIVTAPPTPALEWDEPHEEEHVAPPLSERESSRSEPRVVLKLYGTEAPPAAPSYVEPPAPRHAKPEARAVPHARVTEAAPADPLASYRSALAAIRAQKLVEALPLLELAIEEAPTLTQRIDAVYWRGEVLYLLGRHVEAEVEFASIVSAGVSHPRVPSSLLRLGQCRKARGLAAEAAAIFERLRSEYPTSEAAAQLPREGV